MLGGVIILPMTASGVSRGHADRRDADLAGDHFFLKAAKKDAGLVFGPIPC